MDRRRGWLLPVTMLVCFSITLCLTLWTFSVNRETRLLIDDTETQLRQTKRMLAETASRVQEADPASVPPRVCRIMVGSLSREATSIDGEILDDLCQHDLEHPLEAFTYGECRLFGPASGALLVSVGQQVVGTMLCGADTSLGVWLPRRVVLTPDAPVTLRLQTPAQTHAAMILLEDRPFAAEVHWCQMDTTATGVRGVPVYASVGRDQAGWCSLMPLGLAIGCLLDDVTTAGSLARIRLNKGGEDAKNDPCGQARGGDPGRATEALTRPMRLFAP